MSSISQLFPHLNREMWAQRYVDSCRQLRAEPSFAGSATNISLLLKSSMPAGSDKTE